MGRKKKKKDNNMSKFHSFFSGQSVFAADNDSLLPTSSHSNLKSKANLQEAVKQTLQIVAVAIVFGIILYFIKGSESAYEYYAAFAIEQSLSVDNLFVFLMLFDYFKVPPKFQTRVLNWGIIGAVLMRGIMILLGVTLFDSFAWIQIIFSLILFWSAYKFLYEDEDDEDLEQNWIIKICTYLFPTSKDYDEDRFWTKTSQGSAATPLFLCLICVELSDVVFALDSIPAVLAISHDSIIVYMSNIFAIAGLRALYVIISRAVQDLPYLKPAVALVLFFTGLKMLAGYFNFHIDTKLSLIIVLLCILGGIALSVFTTMCRRKNLKRI